MHDAANEATYELIAEPIQEPQAGEQHEDAGEHPCEEVADPADLQGKPGSITSISSIQRYYLNIVHLSSYELNETLVCMLLLGTYGSLLVCRHR